MEQFFEITRESNAYQAYFDWYKNKEEIRIVINDFFKENNIESSRYIARRYTLYIDGNSQNRALFSGQLLKYSENGMVAFKKNSVIGKAWCALGVNPISKPCVPFFFKDANGEMHTRLFHIDDKVYCSIELYSNNTELSTPTGFIKMKASEYFKIIEEQIPQSPPEAQ